MAQAGYLTLTLRLDLQASGRLKVASGSGRCSGFRLKLAAPPARRRRLADQLRLCMGLGAPAIYGAAR